MLIEDGTEQEITVVQLVMHKKLLNILEDAAKKRGKAIHQVLTEAILEKADELYREDNPEKGRD